MSTLTTAQRTPTFRSRSSRIAQKQKKSSLHCRLHRTIPRRFQLMFPTKHFINVVLFVFPIVTSYKTAFASDRMSKIM